MTRELLMNMRLEKLNGVMLALRLFPVETWLKIDKTVLKEMNLFKTPTAWKYRKNLLPCQFLTTTAPQIWIDKG
jgi:hypothetical protein